MKRTERGKLFFGAMVTLLLLVNLNQALFGQQQDQITITTYFPAPVAAYRWLRTLRMAVGPDTPMPGADGFLTWGNGTNSRGQLRSDHGSSIELGGNGAPHIWFQTTNPVYNAAITLSSVDEDTLLFLSDGAAYTYTFLYNNVTYTHIARTTQIRPIGYDDASPPGQRAWRDLYVRCLKYHWGWCNVALCTAAENASGTCCQGDICRSSLKKLPGW